MAKQTTVQQQQTTVQQQQTAVQQQQTAVQQQSHVQNYYDNRSLTFQVPASPGRMPSSPVPPTPRGRPRSRTPSRARKARDTSEKATKHTRKAAAASSSTRQAPAPATPGSLPFSPGIPETPPYSAIAPGTPEYQFEAGAQPLVPLLGETAIGETANVQDLSHNELPSVGNNDNVNLEQRLPVPAGQPQPTMDDPRASASDAQAPPEPLPQLPQKRTADVLLSHVLFQSGVFELCVDDFGEAILQRGDEMIDMPLPFHTEHHYQCYLASKQRIRDLQADGVNEDFTREDGSSSEDEVKTVSNNRTHTHARS